jgi:hypothetical protein
VLIDDLYLKMHLYPNRISNLMNQKNLSEKKISYAMKKEQIIPLLPVQQIESNQT